MAALEQKVKKKLIKQMDSTFFLFFFSFCFGGRYERARVLTDMTSADVGRHVAKDLGLPQYEKVFIDHDISGQEVASIVMRDLKNMGIKSVGHRHLILESFRQLRAARAAQARMQNLHKWSEYGLICCECYPRQFKLTQSSIKIEKNYCCGFGYQDQLDMTVVKDVGLDRGCCWNRVEIESHDPTTPLLAWIMGKDSSEEVVHSIRIAMEANQDRLANIRGDRAANS